MGGGWWSILSKAQGPTTAHPLQTLLKAELDNQPRYLLLEREFSKDVDHQPMFSRSVLSDYSPSEGGQVIAS